MRHKYVGIFIFLICGSVVLGAGPVATSKSSVDQTMFGMVNLKTARTAIPLFMGLVLQSGAPAGHIAIPAGNNVTSAFDLTFDPIKLTVSRTTMNYVFQFVNSSGVYMPSQYGPYSKIVPNSNGTYTLSFVGNPSTSIIFDSTGQLYQQISNGVVLHTFTHDSSARLTSDTDYAGNVKTYTYGSNGQLATLNYAGRTVSFSYDSGYDLTSISVSGVTVATITYAYKGMASSVTYPNSGVTIILAYDTYGNILSIQNSTNGTLNCNASSFTWGTNQVTVKDADTLVYAFDSSLRLSSVQNSYGTVTYTYPSGSNLPSQLTSVKNLSTGGTATNTETYTREPNFGLVSALYRGGVLSVSTAYNAFGEITDQSRAGAPKIHNDYDANGVLQDTIAGAITTTYLYDSNGCLSQRATTGGNSSTFTNNSLCQPISIQNQNGTETRSYASSSYLNGWRGTLTGKVFANGVSFSRSVSQSSSATTVTDTYTPPSNSSDTASTNTVTYPVTWLPEYSLNIAIATPDVYDNYSTDDPTPSGGLCPNVTPATSTSSSGSGSGGAL